MLLASEVRTHVVRKGFPQREEVVCRHKGVWVDIVWNWNEFRTNRGLLGKAFHDASMQASKYAISSNFP